MKWFMDYRDSFLKYFKNEKINLHKQELDCLNEFPVCSDDKRLKDAFNSLSYMRFDKHITHSHIGSPMFYVTLTHTLFQDYKRNPITPLVKSFRVRMSDLDMIEFKNERVLTK